MAYYKASNFEKGFAEMAEYSGCRNERIMSTMLILNYR
jgi:hypothetical protein